MNYTLLGVIVVLFIITNFGRKIITKNLTVKLTNYIYRGDFNSFDVLINKKYVKYLIHPFNIDYLKLNKALVSENTSEINIIFDKFDNVQLTEVQKKSIYQKAFYYYLQDNNQTKLKHYYELIYKLEDKTLLNKVEDTYKICVLKEDSLLDKYLDIINKAPNDTNALFLLYNMYMNKKDDKLAKEYFDKFNKAIQENVYTK